jgi:hypothetical protein
MGDYKCAGYESLSQSAMSIEFEESVEAEAIGSDNDKPAGSDHALAIIVPTAIARPAVASTTRRRGKREPPRRSPLPRTDRQASGGTAP